MTRAIVRTGARSTRGRGASRGIRRVVATAAILLSPHLAGAADEAPRVIAAGAAITDTIVALGAGSTLVGVDTTSDLPPELQKVARVGYLRTLGAEGLLSLSPTLVLLSEEAGPPGVIEQVRAAGVRCEVIAASETGHGGGNPHAAGQGGGNPHAAGQAGGNPHSAGSDPHAAGTNPHAAATNPHAAGANPYASGANPHAAGSQAAPPAIDAAAFASTQASRTIREVAALLDRKDRGEELVRELEADLKTAVRKSDAPASALFVVHPPRQGAALVAGAGTPADVMLQLAGAKNAATGVFGYRPLTPEAAALAAPEIVVVPAGTLKASGGADSFLEAAGLAQTPAARTKRVVEVAPWMLGFGPKTAIAVRELAGLIDGQDGDASAVREGTSADSPNR